MSWLPRFSVGGWSGCDADDATYEGRVFIIYWLRWTVEIVFAEREQ